MKKSKDKYLEGKDIILIKIRFNREENDNGG